MPAPICRIGSKSDITCQADRAACETNAVDHASHDEHDGGVCEIVQQSGGEIEHRANRTSVRLLVLSERLPAIGRQNSEMKLIDGHRTISMPSAPNDSAYPATIGLASILLDMKQNVASMTNAISRVMRRSCLRRGCSGWFDCCAGCFCRTDQMRVSLVLSCLFASEHATVAALTKNGRPHIADGRWRWL